jgi:putative endonuclease
MKPSALSSKVSLAPHLSAGIEAENRAAKFLVSQGIEIIDRNFRVKGGEIDIVGQEAEMLLFVEVRWRRSAAFGGAIESIHSKKIKRMQHAATVFLQRYHCIQPCRLDFLCQIGSEHSEWLWVRGLL